MFDRAFLKPGKAKDGTPLLVRVPNAKPPRHLRADGENVKLNGYWQRRLLRRDVYRAPEPTQAAAAPATPPEPPKPIQPTREAVEAVRKAFTVSALKMKLDAGGYAYENAASKTTLAKLALANGLIEE